MKPCMICRWVRKNVFISVVYLVSTAFFLWQHSLGFAWDFAVYTMNAEYLFHGGHYFEWARAPLTPVLLGLSGGYWIGEYVYIIIVSTLFLFATLKLSGAAKIDARMLYALLLNPATLAYGILEGTELLSLSLMMLFIVYIHKADAVRSGVAGGLTFLARYTNYLYFIFALFMKDWRKIIRIIAISFLIILPWLGFNYIMKGDLLTSFTDMYTMNVQNRAEYFFMPPDPLHFLLMGNYMWILGGIGIYLFIRSRDWDRLHLMVLLVLVITMFSYTGIPLKIERYLFNIMLPLAFFSAIWIGDRLRPAFFVAANFAVLALVMLLSLSGMISYGFSPYSDYSYLDSGCMTASNNWVELNYAGVVSEPPPREWQVQRYIGEGYRIVIFKKEFFDSIYESYKDMKIPVVMETEGLVVYGNESRCKPPGKVDLTYVERLEKAVGERD